MVTCDYYIPADATMSTFIVQIIIRQWDKSQNTPHHIDERAALPRCYPLAKETCFYAFDKQCIIDKQGDDIQGNRIRYKQIDDETIEIDLFKIALNTKLIAFIGHDDIASSACDLGSLDNNHIQCQYQWRYRVFEGGFYYWMYEHVTFNAIYVSTLDENVFINAEPDIMLL